MPSIVGDVNRNQQKLIAKTKMSGNDSRQYVWVVECQVVSGQKKCAHQYGVNGTDFFQRLCPICQGGRKGLSIEGYVHANRT